MSQVLLQKTADSLVKEYAGMSPIRVVIQKHKDFKGSRKLALYKSSSNTIIVRPDYPKNKTSFPLVIKALRRELNKAYAEQTGEEDDREDRVTFGDRLLEADTERLALYAFAIYGLIFGGLMVLNKVISGKVNGSPVPHVVGYMLVALGPLFSLLLSLELGFIQDGIVWWRRRTGKEPPRDTSYDGEETWLERTSIYVIGAVVILAILTGLVLPILIWLGI